METSTPVADGANFDRDETVLVPIFDSDVGITWDFPLFDMPAHLTAGYHVEIWLDAIRRYSPTNNDEEFVLLVEDLMLHGPRLSLTIDTTGMLD